LSKGCALCEKKVIDMLNDFLTKRMTLAASDGEEHFDAEFNVRVVKDADRYYRATYYGGAESWNLRDGHMFDVLTRLMKYNPGSKAVIWAHNSDVGDARYTGISKRREHSIGQL
jgi:erythromycin esterase-like protein